MPSADESRRLAPTVAELDRELTEHAAIADAVIAEQQAQLAAARREVATLTSELAGVRELLGLARAELHWLRRAGIDLNAVMEHPVTRAARRAALLVTRRRPAHGDH